MKNGLFLEKNNTTTRRKWERILENEYNDNEEEEKIPRQQIFGLVWLKFFVLISPAKKGMLAVRANGATMCTFGIDPTQPPVG